MSLNKKLMVILAFIFVAACTSVKSPMQAYYASMTMRSASYLNPDIYGKAAPVVVTIFQLKSPHKFTQASYQDLINNSGKTLGTDLLDKTIVEIRPKMTKKFTIPLSATVQYIGIVAAYRNIDHAVWRKVVRIKGKSPAFSIGLESNQLLVNSGKQGIVHELR